MIRAGLAEVRAESRADHAEIRAEICAGLAEVRDDLRRLDERLRAVEVTLGEGRPAARGAGAASRPAAGAVMKTYPIPPPGGIRGGRMSLSIRPFGVLMSAAAVLAPFAAPAQPQDAVLCAYESKQVCTPDGCRDDDVGDAFLLVPPFGSRFRPTEQFFRCDSRGCTAVSVSRAFSTGVFGTFTAPAYSLRFAEITPFGGPPAAGDFVETAAIGLNLIIYRGSCPEVLSAQ